MDTSLSRNLVRAEVKHLISAQDFQVWGLLIVEAILRLKPGPWVHCPEQLRLSALSLYILTIYKAIHLGGHEKDVKNCETIKIIHVLALIYYFLIMH